jgi:hypothetical protein
MIKTIISLTLAATFSSYVFAQTDSKPATCTETKSASELVAGKIRDWYDTDFGKQLDALNDRGQIVLSKSDAISVMSPVSNSGFGKSRIVAYDKAFLSAQAKFIKERSRNIQTELASKRFDSAPPQDQLKLDEEEKSGRIMRIGEKLFALTESKLDAALREEGVEFDPTQKIEPSKKVELYNEAVSRSTTVTAFGEIAGMLPVENIEAVDCTGQAAVAVIAVYSNNTRDFAQSVLRVKPIAANPEKATGISLRARVSQEIKDNDILYMYGLRLGHDQDGYPAILSYGQWSFAPTGTSPQSRERAKTTALNFAEATAESQLALYLSGSMNLLDKTFTAEESREVATITRDNVSNETATEMVESQLKKVAARATAKITGVRELDSWSIEYPGQPGVMLVGKILAWSPQYADAIRAATGSSQKQAVNPQSNNQDQTGSNTESSVRSSKKVNNASDF